MTGAVCSIGMGRCVVLWGTEEPSLSDGRIREGFQRRRTSREPKGAQDGHQVKTSWEQGAR